jgi:ABC-type Fe3+-siderophore transport system permease subunit
LAIQADRRFSRIEPRCGGGDRAWPDCAGAVSFAFGTLLPLAAPCGGLATTVLIGSRRAGRTSVATMLLAGIALAALAMALTGILIHG